MLGVIFIIIQAHMQKTAKFQTIYKQIKKNEICDNSYNFLNNKNNNLKKSIEKFNLINKIDTINNQ